MREGKTGAGPQPNRHRSGSAMIIGLKCFIGVSLKAKPSRSKIEALTMYAHINPN